MKYLDYMVTFREVPNEVSLCINITECPNHCHGCHSPELRQSIGKELNKESLKTLIEKNNGITTICFMGGDGKPDKVNKLAQFVKKNYPNLKTCWYSGNETLSKAIDLQYWDFIKLGPYEEKYGPLDKVTTNQRFYEVQMSREMDENNNPVYGLMDITENFWK